MSRTPQGAPLGSFNDLLASIDEEAPGLDPRRVCVHCFTGTEDQLRELVARGFMVGITGFVCMRRRGAILRAALARGALPLAQLMVETDAPYTRGDAEGEVAAQTMRNAARFFAIEV